MESKKSLYEQCQRLDNECWDLIRADREEGSPDDFVYELFIMIASPFSEEDSEEHLRYQIDARERFLKQQRGELV